MASWKLCNMEKTPSFPLPSLLQGCNPMCSQVVLHLRAVLLSTRDGNGVVGTKGLLPLNARHALSLFPFFFPFLL